MTIVPLKMIIFPYWQQSSMLKKSAPSTMFKSTKNSFVLALLPHGINMELPIIRKINGSTYSRTDQVKFVENSL